MNMTKLSLRLGWRLALFVTIATVFANPRTAEATTFAGRVAAVTDHSFRFRSHWWDLVVHEDPSTIVRCGKSTVPPQLLEPGDYVEIKGKWDGERSILARKIKIRRRESECERRRRPSLSGMTGRIDLHDTTVTEIEVVFPSR
jgi:hypothetical protein